MRILSQDGLRKYGYMDFPYEMCALSMGYAGDKEKFYIYAHMPRAIEQKIAEYSTEEKARKAMEMLIEEYTGVSHERRIDDLYARLKYGGKTDIRLLVESLMIKGKYFRFPADNEIEA